MNNLKWLRKQKGLTQEELASELGTTNRSYQRIEAEEVQIKPKELKVLADYFGVNEGYIWGIAHGPGTVFQSLSLKSTNGQTNAT